MLFLRGGTCTCLPRRRVVSAASREDVVARSASRCHRQGDASRTTPGPWPWPGSQPYVHHARRGPRVRPGRWAVPSGRPSEVSRSRRTKRTAGCTWAQWSCVASPPSGGGPKSGAVRSSASYGVCAGEARRGPRGRPPAARQGTQRTVHNDRAAGSRSAVDQNRLNLAAGDRRAAAVADHRRASRHRRPSRTYVGQGVPADPQAAQPTVCVTHIRYSLSPRGAAEPVPAVTLAPSGRIGNYVGTSGPLIRAPRSVAVRGHEPRRRAGRYRRTRSARHAAAGRTAPWRAAPRCERRTSQGRPFLQQSPCRPGRLSMFLGS